MELLLDVHVVLVVVAWVGQVELVDEELHPATGVLEFQKQILLLNRSLGCASTVARA